MESRSTMRGLCDYLEIHLNQINVHRLVSVICPCGGLWPLTIPSSSNTSITAVTEAALI